MKVGASLNRAPFVATVEACACKCDGPVKELATARTAEKAIAIINGYWSIYLTFFGEQMNWLRFTVTDVRDGTVIWRNGRVMKKEENSGEGTADAGTSAAGRRAEPGRWIIGGGHADDAGTGRSQGDGW